MTDTTKSSIMAYCLTSPTQIPNALTANIWGSVNWGLYYLHDTARDSSTYLTGKDAEMIKFQEEHFENDKFYRFLSKRICEFRHTDESFI